MAAVEDVSNTLWGGPRAITGSDRPIVGEVRLSDPLRKAIDAVAAAAPFESAIELVRACRLAGVPDAVVIDVNADPDGVIVMRSDAVTAAVPIVAVAQSESAARLAVENGADITCSGDPLSVRRAVAVAVATRRAPAPMSGDGVQAMVERVAALTHEIRSPITALRGYVDLLAMHWREMPEDTLDEALLALQRVSARLWHRIEDLLMLASLDGDGLRMQAHVVEVRPAIHRAVELAAADPAAVSIRCSEGLEVVAASDRIEQILANLMTNAFRHGVPPVVVRAWSEGQVGRIEVQDQGDSIVDIPDERLFARASPLAGQARGSVGLGLYVSRALAEAMGGTLTFAPRDGKSTFLLSLPLPSA